MKSSVHIGNYLSVSNYFKGGGNPENQGRKETRNLVVFCFKVHMYKQMIWPKIL